MGKPCSCTQFIKAINLTTSHIHRVCAMKSRIRMIKPFITVVPSYTSISLVCIVIITASSVHLQFMKAPPTGNCYRQFVVAPPTSDIALALLTTHTHTHTHRSLPSPIFRVCSVPMKQSSAATTSCCI